MRTNELIECFREIVQNFDESQQHHVNEEILYWRSRFLNSIGENMRAKNIFLSLPSETFKEKTAEEWVEYIRKGF